MVEKGSHDQDQGDTAEDGKGDAYGTGMQLNLLELIPQILAGES